MRIVLCFIIFCATVLNALDTIVIDTKLGKIMGQISKTYFVKKRFYAFRGIPYAAPPIGDLRFRASVPPLYWQGVYNATFPRSVCVQTINTTNLNENRIIGSEDCLYLDVYTPKLPSKKNKKLPVLCWIHGGNYLHNSGNLGLHGTSRIVSNDVVVVTLNYRLGIFGFLSTADSECPGNYGLKDIIIALRWIQNNIACFGGDPSQVTLMGSNSGAVLVSYLLLSERAEGLFHRAISESGDALVTWADQIRPRFNAFGIGALNGIITVFSSDLMNRLRSIDAYTLQRTISSPLFLGPLDLINGLQFAPVIEDPSLEAVVTGYNYEKMISGNFIRVPILRGFNSLESRYFQRVSPSQYNSSMVWRNLLPSQFVPRDMHINGIDQSRVGTAIRSHYFGNGLSDPNINSDFAEYFTDDNFIRGIVKAAELQSRYCPVHLYRFSFTGGILHSRSTPDGAEHMEELQFLWLNLGYEGNDTVMILHRSAEATLTSKRLVGLWVNFIKTGNPTPTVNDIIKVKWPVVNNGSDGNLYYLNIGSELKVLKNPRHVHMKVWDELYKTFGHRPFHTY